MAISDSSKMHFSSEGDQEVPYDEFWVTPPFHFMPQKVKGFVVELIGHRQETIIAILALMENLSGFI